MDNTKRKKEIGLDTFITLFVVVGMFTYIASVMGVGNMFNTLMATAHDLLLNTVFFIMAIAVLTGLFQNFFQSLELLL